MRKNILSIAIAIIALFSVTAVFAQNPKISNPDKLTVALHGSYASDNSSFTACVDYARCTGLGNATSVTATLTAVGTATTDCFNNGQDTGPIPGQKFSTTGGTVTLTPKNGVLEVTGVCVTIGGTCKGQAKNWTSTVSNVQITDLYLTLNGSQVSLKDYIGQLGL